MATEQLLDAENLMAIVEAIKSFPTQREVSHCGQSFTASPLAFYGVCPVCRTRIKLRSFCADTEFEDVIDAVLEWQTQPGMEEFVQKRIQDIKEDR